MSAPKILNISPKIRTIFYEQAQKSNCIHKLGSFITKGRNKIISRGYNDNKRTSYLNLITPCQHAEMKTVAHFINSYVLPNQAKVSNQA